MPEGPHIGSWMDSKRYRGREYGRRREHGHSGEKLMVIGTRLGLARTSP